MLPSLSADVFEQAGGGDATQPRIEARGIAQLVEIVVGRVEGVLSEVGGAGGVPHVAPHEGLEPGTVARHQAQEGVAVAGLGVGDKGAV